MKKLSLGSIGKEEVISAIKKLEGREDIKNIWAHTDNDNIITGRCYDDLYDLIDGEYYYKIYNDEQSYREECKYSGVNLDYDINSDQSYCISYDIIKLLKEGMTAYYDCENDRVYSDLVDMVKFMITDGESRFYTYEEASENLKSDYVDDALVIYILEKLQVA